jgi:hypothetical protein
MTECYDNADYIGEITASLAKIARKDGLSQLAFILDMATLEACRYMDRCADAPSEEPMKAAN